MTSTTETAVVTRELVIDATPETVWKFLVDSEKATRWMGQEATLEPREGGLYRVGVIPGHTASGRFVSLERPSRLVFTWGWEPGEGEPATVTPGSSTIEIVLVPEGSGTRLTFTHSDLPSREAAETHTVGWDHYLPRLAAAASGSDPGRDPWLDREL
jgi:uncharacterized protein YndB with AHSA1/START domain